jgi:hypothetical protein
LVQRLVNGFIESSARVFPRGSVFQVNGWTASANTEHPTRSIGQKAFCGGLAAVDSEKEFHVDFWQPKRKPGEPV